MVPADARVVRKWHVLRLLAVGGAMFGFGFAMVPMYNAICQLTNVNGKDNGMLVRSDVVEQPDLSREVTVQFLTTVNGGGNWGFKPEVQSMKVHPGELYTVNFVAHNPNDSLMVAQAVPSVTPWDAAAFLKKTECFCFSNQTFAAGESKHMPVRFMLTTAIPPDVDTVTLSYTFFNVTAQASNAAKSESPRI